MWNLILLRKYYIINIVLLKLFHANQAEWMLDKNIKSEHNLYNTLMHFKKWLGYLVRQYAAYIIYSAHINLCNVCFQKLTTQ